MGVGDGRGIMVGTTVVGMRAVGTGAAGEEVEMVVGMAVGIQEEAGTEAEMGAVLGMAAEEMEVETQVVTEEEAMVEAT